MNSTFTVYLDKCIWYLFVCIICLWPRIVSIDVGIFINMAIRFELEGACIYNNIEFPQSYGSGRDDFATNAPLFAVAFAADIR